MRAGLVAGIAVLLLNLAAPTATATGFNRYTVNVSPSSVAAGESASFTATVKNLSPIGVLNELKLTVPPSLAIGSVSTSRGIASRSGNVVSVKRILLLPGKSFTVTVGATASCESSGSASWGTWAKGLLLPFFLNSSGNQLTTTFTGACLQFVPGGNHTINVNDQLGNSAEVTALTTGGGTLTASFTQDNTFTCGAYDYVPFSESTLVFNVTSGGMQVTLSSLPDGPVDMETDVPTEVCLQSSLAFLDENGATVPPGSMGLLPNCVNYDDDDDYYYYYYYYGGGGGGGDDTPVPPCVLDRGWDLEAGTFFTTFLTAPGDPKGRH